jgi:hypothetical protein
MGMFNRSSSEPESGRQQLDGFVRTPATKQEKVKSSSMTPEQFRLYNALVVGGVAVIMLGTSAYFGWALVRAFIEG